MKIYIILGALAVGFVIFISYFLYWAVFQGQYDDIDKEGESILLDDDDTSHLVDSDSDSDSGENVVK